MQLSVPKHVAHSLDNFKSCMFLLFALGLNVTDYTFLILALAFVRPDDIMTYVDALEEHLDEDGTIVFNWFDDTYIGRASRRGNGWRLLHFPCTLWNVHERVLLQLEKN